MERVAIVVRLKEGSGPRATELIEAGPPFDLAETGVLHHTVYLSAGEVVFVFETRSNRRSKLHSSGGGRSSTARRGSLANGSPGERTRTCCPLLT